MIWIRTEEEVDALIDEMKNRAKGKYITQGVAFNKNCPRQMELLKKSLMSSASFSGLAKEVLAVKFSENEKSPHNQTHNEIPNLKNKPTNLGNFI